MKKQIVKLLLVFFLMVIYAYILVIINLPDNLVIFEGEDLRMKTIFGISLKVNQEKIEAVSSSISKSDFKSELAEQKSGKATVEVSLFDIISLKDVEIDILPKTKVIPVGNIAGVKLYTSGVLVVGMSEIEGIDSKKYKPYENTGIKEGDTITRNKWYSELIQQNS